MRWKIKKQDLYNFFFIVLYKIALDLFYYFFILPVWGYAGFELNFNILKFVESFFLLIVIFLLIPKSKERLSNIMVWLLVLLSYVPMLTIFAFMDQPRIYMYAVTGFWMLVFLLLNLPTISVTPFKRPQSKIMRYGIFIILSGLVFFLIYKYLGVFFNFDFAKVYDIRAEYGARGVALAGYLFHWSAYIVNPIFFAIFLVKRNWFLVGVVIFLQVLLFSVTGMKAFLFALPFVLVLIWIISRKNPLFWMAFGLTALILVGLLSYWLIDYSDISSLVVRRVLFVPAQLSFFYYDFFSQHDHTFLSQHRIFGDFLDYPYHLPPANLIGEVYYDSSKTSANNGLYADAYMSFGFIGFVFWAILLTIILKLIDSFSQHKQKIIAVAAIARPAGFLINSAFLTSLLTHGLLLSLIILYLLPKEKK